MTHTKLENNLEEVIRTSIKRAAGDIILLYRLTQEPQHDNHTSNTQSSQYSLTVTKVDCGGTRREVRRLPDLTRNRTEAEQIYELLSRGLVTPCTLDEVIDDLFAM